MAIVKQKAQKIIRFTVEISKEKGERGFGRKCYDFKSALIQLFGEDIVIRQITFPIVEEEENHIYTIEVPLKIQEMAEKTIHETLVRFGIKK